MRCETGVFGRTFMTYKIRLRQCELDIDAIFVYAFVAITLYSRLFQWNSMVSAIFSLVLGIGALRGYAVCIKQRFMLPIGLGLFFLGCWLFCFVMRGFFQPTYADNLGDILRTVCYIGLAVLLLKKSIGLWGSGLLLVICAGFIIARLLMGVDAGDIVLNASRNYVSVILLFCILLYYLALYQSGRRGLVLVLFPAIVFFAVCVAASGRGGILTSGFLLCMLCVYELLHLSGRRAVKGLWIFFLIIAAAVICYLFLTQRITLTLGKFGSRGMIDSARLEIWATFFKNNTNSVVDFLCGSDISTFRVDNNVHNSFLQCYEDFGLIAFCGLVVLSVKAVIDGIRQRDLFWTILILTLFLRAFTDKLFYSSYCELFLYYFLMYWRYQKRIFSDQTVDIVQDSGYNRRSLNSNVSRNF